MSEPIPPEDLPDPPTLEDPDPIPPPVDFPDGDEVVGWLDAEVSGDRVNVFDAPIVAGDPLGARIEIRSTGFHAFNGTGTETAHIDGAEGVFVGGEFRTSDALPGQVTLSDNAYTLSTTGATYPGISINPIDASTTATPPGIGSYGDGVIVDGGKATTGESSYIVANPRAVFLRSLRSDGTSGGGVQTSPEFSFIRTNRPDGTTGGIIQTSPEFSVLKTYRADGTTGGEIQTSPEFSVLKTYRADGGDGGEVVSSPDRSRVRTYSGNGEESGWVMAQPNSAELASLDSSNAYVSQIKASATEAFLYASAGGTRRYLSVDANGVWVKTNKSGSFKNYNLEETAQDTGWLPLVAPAGVNASANYAYRNKGGVIWFRGSVSPATEWLSGWNVIGSVPDASARPSATTPMREGSSTSGQVLLRVQASGEIALYIHPDITTRTGTYYMSAMTYPAG